MSVALDKKGHMLPTFDQHLARTKYSQFLAVHIPLVCNRIRSVLVSISVKSSILGYICQSLYDKTRSISHHPGWETSLASLVDQQIPSPASPLSSSLTKPEVKVDRNSQ